jgi:phospholipase/carboxylesterase
MSLKYESPIVLEPQGTARSAIIWLHGLGANGHDFVPIVPELGVQEDLGLRFIFPHAAVQPVTLNGGYPMPAWYDMVSIELERKLDLAGVAQSVAYVEQLIGQQLASGISLDKLVLAGFSQGGVVVLDCALRMPNKPAGVMALSTYLAESIGDGKGLDIFQAHGIQDDVVAIALAHQAESELRALGAKVNSHEYTMPHSVCEPEIRDIAHWLRERLS